jgi:vacuolar-type H+-ATPase subunit F/Vma7
VKPVIVSPTELADGFRLAGIQVFEIDERQAIEPRVDEIIRAIRQMEDAAIVLVDERYMEPFEAAFAANDLPMVASFPSNQVAHDQPYIDELTLRYLGQKLYIGGEDE